MSAQLPTFEEFSSFRRDVVAARPEVIDLAETRFATAVAPQLTDVSTLDVPAVGYRCHVAEQWLECFGLPADWKPRALVCQGVRDALRRLFEHTASTGRRWLLPSDVYPVYLKLAAEAGVQVQTYASMTDGLSTVPAGVDCVLVTSPFKPRGTPLQAYEVAALTQWLSTDASRRVVVDAVYTFGRDLDSATHALLATGQALVLHSLSKGWGRPLLAGVVLVPEQDVETMTPLFRGLAVDRSRLAVAHALLEQDRRGPQTLELWLAGRKLALFNLLDEQGLLGRIAPATMPGAYLFQLNTHWRDLFATGLLALPASAFGSNVDGLSIVSSLPPLESLLVK